MGKNAIVLLSMLVVGSACSKKSETKSSETVAPSPSEVVEDKQEVKETPAKPVTYELSADQQQALFNSPLQDLAGTETSLAGYKGKVILIVNVASECGLTPQYEGLQALQSTYADRGFTVIGFPCNQFGGQEPGTPEEILAFGKDNYGVTFPLMQKVDTNGETRHPIYQVLTEIKDAAGEAGDVQWNFEKFLISADGAHITRLRPERLPSDPDLAALIEADLK